MSLRNHETLGSYRLLAHLQTGGMAEIHLALQTGVYGFEKLVVIKRILQDLARNTEFLEMFFDEARIAAQLNHPNIVQIYELSQQRGDFFIAMEYLDGESLAFIARTIFSRSGSLDPDLVANIIYGVSEGLHFAHSYCDPSGRSLGIVHRDVSPQNIIVLFSGGVKLLDFGVAKAHSQIHRTKVGMRKGKIAYMSPEQAKGGSVDARSDVFSLGVVLWELLAGQRLYSSSQSDTIFEQILRAQAPRLRKIRSDVPRELEEITLCALRKDPAERFVNAGEMRTALWTYLRNNRRAMAAFEIAAIIQRELDERIRERQKLLEELLRGDDKDATALRLLRSVGEELQPGEHANATDPDPEKLVPSDEDRTLLRNPRKKDRR